MECQLVLPNILTSKLWKDSLGKTLGMGGSWLSCCVQGTASDVSRSKWSSTRILTLILYNHCLRDRHEHMLICFRQWEGVKTPQIYSGIKLEFQWP